MGVEAKAAALLEALPYIQKYRGKILVVKYGGSFMDSDDPEVRARVARDLVFLQEVGIRPVVVHGGGKAIARALESAGIEFTFLKGQRVTTKESVQIVERVLSREINPEIVTMLKSYGANVRGFAGSAVFRCKKLILNGDSGESLDLGLVGEITEVDTKAILQCLDEGCIPVISPTATGKEDGELYNCNADVAAGEAAIALKTLRLVFMSDVPGLMRDPSDPQTVLSRVSLKDIEVLKSDGIIEKGMIPKIESAVKAIRSGVERVSLIDGRVENSLLIEIFTDTGNGTEITA